MLTNAELAEILDAASEDINDWKTIATKIIVQVKKLDANALSSIIRMPDEEIRKEQDKITKGVYIKGGPLAFIDQVNKIEPVINQVPIEGDVVNFVQFAGKAVVLDNREFRVIHDEDVFLYLRRADNGK